MRHKGIQSTEFWLTVIGIIGTLLPMLFGALSPQTADIISAVLVGLYTIARAWVKSTETTTDDKILAEIKKDIIDKLPDITTDKKQ